MQRLSPSNLRAAWWGLRSARRARRGLAQDGLELVLPGPPAGLPLEAERGVNAALRRSGASCLVSSLVRQRWEASHGRRRDLVVGVTGPADFRAHAWLEGDWVPPPEEAGDIPGLELRRVPAANGSKSDSGTPGTRQFHELLRHSAPE